MISVVVPAYNEAKIIRGTLESLQKQDYAGGYEIIVVDNNSRDNTAQVALAMGARVVLCARQGVSYARQAGAEAASGQIIVQADADTIYPPWWLARVQKQFDRHPEAVAVAGTFVYQNPPWWAVFEFFLRSTFNLFSALTLGRPYVISGANFAFRKKALQEIGGYDQSAYSADQFNISTRLSKIGKVIYDRKSWGATDARSVAKPTIVICYDFIQHLLKFACHVLTGPFRWVKKFSRKTNSVSPGTYVKIVVPTLLIAILLYGYFVPASPVFGKVYAKVSTSDKVIALTFDDGPNEPYTSQILDILEKDDVQATFFLIGQNVELYPDVARRMVADGDVIGNHSFSHNANHALSFSYYKDITKAEQAIAAVTGVEPSLYRPPHGRKSPWELGSVQRLGYKEVLWNISTNELSKHTPEFLADQIVKKSKPGGIIDIHDGYGTLHNTAKANKSETVEMVPLIIDRLRDEGYTFVTVSQLLNIPAYAQAKQ
jgi:peptidoglycan/xylan/chitin deacetylase (PgdA/CDA1 family)